MLIFPKASFLIKYVLSEPLPPRPTPPVVPNEHSSRIWAGQPTLQGPFCLLDLLAFPLDEK